MLGDQQDMVSRLKDVLPARWFPDTTPVLDSVLNGLGSAWALVHDFVQYARTQARIATATGEWLDIVAHDYFGSRTRRRSDQSDDKFRREIQQDLIRDRGTRGAVASALSDLTGQSPAIFEPANPTDTGGYAGPTPAGGGIAYGMAGGWGNLDLPFQFFVTAYRPVGAGIASISGWGTSAAGYGSGQIEYADLSMIQGQVTDLDIYAAVADVLPVGVVGWTQIVG